MIQLLTPILFAGAKAGTTILVKSLVKKAGIVILTEVAKEVVKKGIKK